MSSSRPDAARSATALGAVDVAVLAGGLGTRLRSVLGEIPKILAPVGGKPFLDHLLAWLQSYGARRVVLCLGFRAELVLEHLKRHPVSGLEVVTSVEPEPLGTAGGLRLAVPLLHTDPVLVMNGDTFVDADLTAFLTTHHARKAAASVLCATVPSMARYGRLDIDDAGYIRRFIEKDPADVGPGPINAGFYLFSQTWLATFARSTGPSLERDVFANAPAGTFNAVAAPGVAFIDIGTPETYAEAETVIRRALDARAAAATLRPTTKRSVA
jgi:NDP-sugar pyrophosphorylase family protein